MGKTKRLINFGLLSIMLLVVISLSINALVVDAEALTIEDLAEVNGENEPENIESTDDSSSVDTLEYTSTYVDNELEDEKVANNVDILDQKNTFAEEAFVENENQNNVIADTTDLNEGVSNEFENDDNGIVVFNTNNLRAVNLRAVQNNVITSIEALTYDGSSPQGDTGQWDVFRLNASFALPNGQIHAGDTTVITLPDKLKFNQTSSFEIKDSSGNVVANAVINGGAKTVTLTYTDYVDNNSDITGSFYFYVQIDRDNVDGEENIPIEIDVSGKTIVGNTIHFLGIPDPVGHYLTKSGWQVSSVSDRAIRYQLNVNTKQEAIQNLTITDKIATAGFTILRDSLVITKGTWTSVHGDWQLQNQTNATADYNVTWNDDGSFTIHLGDIAATDGFSIRYTAEASYDLVDGEVIQNDAVIRGTNIIPHTASANAYYYVAGGSAEGYVFTINIHKTNESGLSLAGATFNVIRVANNSVVGTITTDASGRGSVTGLLKDNYQIVEVSAPSGYTLADPVDVFPEDFGSDKAVLKTIINYSDKTEVKVSKAWNDANNQDGIRPVSVTVKLLANGSDTGKTVELSADNNWTDAFTELDEYQNGQKITYTVEEVETTGYVSVVDGDAENGFAITNTHRPEIIDINGTKTWNDNDNQDGARPNTITIRLLADGAEIDSVTVSEADDWSWSFTGLPKYKNEGSEIVYSITEDAVSGYTSSYNGYDVTNEHTPGKTSVTVSKAWNDANNQDGIRPVSVTVKLLANGSDTGKTVELSADNNWTDAFTELDEYQNGQKITYTVEEVETTGYVSVVDGDAENGFAITNTHRPEIIDINGTKTWNDNDNQDGARPNTITIRLLADGAEIDSVTVSEADDWSWSFTGLPKYKNEGSEIVYSITEDAVSGYTSSYNGYDVTNEHTPGKTSVTVSKAWNDANNQDGIRPVSVTVKLLANGSDTGKTVELSADNNWTDAFTELDEYQNGQKITYTVEEVETTGYVSVVDGNAEVGFIISNTHEVEKRSIEVTKIWDDQNNADNLRPAEITVRLYADNTETKQTITLNAENNWKGSFNELDVYSDGKLINYSVVEDAVDKYKTTITGSEKVGYTITNSYLPPSRKTPNTSDSSDRGIMLVLFGISMLVLVGSLIIKKKEV